MSTIQNNSNVLYVPEDLTSNILKRLPVKSLIRFQCVCKHWNTLIKNPCFTHQHLQHSHLQNLSSPSLLILFSDFVAHSFFRACMCMLDCDLRVRKFPKMDMMDSMGEGLRIVGSCNGLLLVQSSQYTISHPFSLWNPATASVWHIPTTKTLCSKFYYCLIGFGFSPVVNDYKIVILYAWFSDFIIRAEVFSLSRGSWEKLNVWGVKGVKFDDGAVTVGGAMFWTGKKFSVRREGKTEVKVVVSFDIVNEVFTLIPSPHSRYNAKDKLTIYEDKLAMLRVTWERGSDIVELWVLDEGLRAFGKSWSWSKFGNSFSETLNPLAVWSNNFVSKRRGGTDLRLMNLTTNEVKSFAIDCNRIANHSYYYVESVVSVGDNYKEEC